MKNRLQLRHTDTLFATKQDALNYLNARMVVGEGKRALFAEPLVLKYGTNPLNPNILLAIGSYGDGVTNNNDNKYFIIDTATLERDILQLQTLINGNIGEIEDILIAITQLSNKDIEHDTKLNELLVALNEEIARAKTVEASLIVHTSESDTIRLSTIPSPSGTTIMGDIRISALSGNQIVTQPNAVGGGIYNNVDLTYAIGADNGILTLLINGIVVRTINLPLEQFLRSVDYDNVRQELVLIFAIEGQQDKRVVIPIGDLIDVYTAGLGLQLSNNEFSIKLNTLASEPFITIDNGGLAIHGIQNAINNSVSAERNERVADITAERTERIAADTTLTTDLANEINRAKAAETQNASNIIAETNRSLTAEAAINTTLNSRIDTESTRAQLAESSLHEAIELERTRAKGEEQRIETKVEGNTQRIISEESRSIAVETEIRSDLTTESNRAKAAEMQNANNIIAETNRSLTAEANIEINARIYTDTKVESVQSVLETKINNAEINAKLHSDNNDIIINNRIDTVNNKSIFANGIDSSLTLDSNRAGNGDVYITGQTNISASNQLIDIKDDGLAVGLSLTYTNGILVLKGVNGVVVGEANIAIDGMISDVKLVENTLVFEFKLTDGTTETIEIPLDGLIKDWDVDNNKIIGGKRVSVDLFKDTTGTIDKLSANVKIIDTPQLPNGTIENNILGKTQDGILFVDGITNRITHKTQFLNGVLDTFDTSLIDNRNNEIVGGTYYPATGILALSKRSGNQIAIPGFTTGGGGTGGGTGLQGVTVTTTTNGVLLNDNQGTVITIDLQHIINAAVSKAITDIFTTSRFVASDATNQVTVNVDTVTPKVTIGFSDTAKLEGIEY